MFQLAFAPIRCARVAAIARAVAAAAVLGACTEDSPTPTSPAVGQRPALTTVTGPVVEMTTSLTFGPQLVDVTSAPQVITLRNVGNAPLELITGGVAGPNAGDFRELESPDMCTVTPVPSGATCTFTIVFRPTGVGPRSAYAWLESNAGMLTIAFSGTGFDLLPADVSVSVGATPNPAQVNKPLTYTISVTNSGPNAATSVALSDVIPSTTTFASLEAPGGATCSTPAVGGTGTVTCALGSLPRGATRTVKLTVKVLSGGRNAIANTATVATSSPDLVSSNNVATVATTVYGRK